MSNYQIRQKLTMQLRPGDVLPGNRVVTRVGSDRFGVIMVDTTGGPDAFDPWDKHLVACPVLDAMRLRSGG